MDQWQRFRASWRMTSNWNKLLVLLTAVIAVSNGCYSCYARKQFVIMYGTLAEMKRSGEQSTDQIWRAIENLNWMARSADSSQKSTQTAVENSDRQNKKSIAAVLEAGAKTDEISKLALKASIEASQLDQRAWVGMLTQGLSTKATVIGDYGLDINAIVLPLVNSGRTPALNMTAHYIVRLRTWQDPIPDYDEVMSKMHQTPESSSGFSYAQPGAGGNTEKYLSWDETFLKAQVLGPGSIQGINIAKGKIGDRRATKDDGSTLYVYVIGTINYDDAVGTKKRHRTRFCLVNEGGADFHFCLQQNWMD